jgi:hypothetical protein
MMRSSIICTFHQILLGRSNQGGYEVGRACSTYGRNKKCADYIVLVGNLNGRDHLEDLGVTGRIILKQM